MLLKNCVIAYKIIEKLLKNNNVNNLALTKSPWVFQIPYEEHLEK